MNELDEKNEVQITETVNNDFKKPLVIFKTEMDRYGRDITLMSNFFDGYIHQMSLSLKQESKLEAVVDLPIADIGIINDIIQQSDVIRKGDMTLVPDFDNLPLDIKDKLKKNIYKVGESKQVEGNLRAVILDENDRRIRDITLKKSFCNNNNAETIRSIGNQLRMRQIYVKLTEIQEFQTYQLEKDRDRDIIVPFLDARSLVIEAETKEDPEERIQFLKEADGKIRTALNSIYADIETTSKSLAKRVKYPFIHFGNGMNNYMTYLISDIQIATKYIGVRMQLLEFLGESKTANSVLCQFYHVMQDFLTKPIAKNGGSASGLLHDYFPYDRTNRNCWYHFSKEMIPSIESSIEMLETKIDECNNNDIYVVAVEEIDDEE